MCVLSTPRWDNDALVGTWEVPAAALYVFCNWIGGEIGEWPNVIKSFVSVFGFNLIYYDGFVGDFLPWIISFDVTVSVTMRSCDNRVVRH